VSAGCCPACGHSDMRVIHEQRGIPVNSCLLVDTAADAKAFPRGDLVLALCRRCGFIANTAFDERLATYSQRYEETQGYSEHFRTFAEGLATRWVERYDIRDKDVLEIGCGKGEFLALMCEIGRNRGIGVDPSALPDRLVTAPGTDVRLVPDFYDERYAGLPADVVVCRHTLEHIAPVREFMQMVRRVIGDRSDTVVLFEVPDVLRVLREAAFWDVYYEHCSYLSVGSLVRLFRETGFDVLDVDRVYDDQYLLIEARPAVRSATAAEPVDGEDDLAAVTDAAVTFSSAVERIVGRWRHELVDGRPGVQPTVIWGAGSKGVAYLTTLGADAAACAVDINPHKHGKFLAGSAHEVVSPSALPGLRPDLVVAMNPVYVTEIQAQLDRLGVPATLVAV
jgi:SAM-dependent methyltransferase